MVMHSSKSITLFLLFFVSLSWGQSKVLFKGIPLGIPEDSFTSQLENKGFVPTSPSKIHYEGPFFSGDEFEYVSSVSYLTTPYSNKVTMVHVYIPAYHIQNPWTSEAGRFKKFVDLFKRKYGEAQIYFIPQNESMNKNAPKMEIPYSKIGSIDEKKAGEYRMEWTIDYKAGIALTLHVEPEYIKGSQRKKALGVIPYGIEDIQDYYRTKYSISVFYYDHSVGRSGSIGSIDDI